jgi:cytochrome P450
MIEPFIEEAMRKFGIVNIVRVTKQEVQIGDALLRPGEPVMCLLPMAGLDPAKNPDPEKFMIERPGRQHLIFGGGVHTCLGNALARRELKVLTQEWLAAIPRFGLQPGFRPQYRLGQQTSLEHLLLQWSPERG